MVPGLARPFMILSTLTHSPLKTARSAPTNEPQQARKAYAQSQGAEAAQAQMLVGMSLLQLWHGLEAIPVLRWVVRSLHSFDRNVKIKSLLVWHRERVDLEQASNLLQTAVRPQAVTFHPQVPPKNHRGQTG